MTERGERGWIKQKSMTWGWEMNVCEHLTHLEGLMGSQHGDEGRGIRTATTSPAVAGGASSWREWSGWKEMSKQKSCRGSGVYGSVKGWG